MESAAAWLGDQLKTLAGKAVTIDYGEVRVENITGWCAQHTYDVMDAEGFATSLRSYDWQFKLADLPEDLLNFENVVVMDGFDKYEAMPLGNRPWHESLDTSGQLITIHTKQVN